jgi:hypothetical protein
MSDDHDVDEPDLHGQSADITDDDTSEFARLPTPQEYVGAYLDTKLRMYGFIHVEPEITLLDDGAIKVVYTVGENAVTTDAGIIAIAARATELFLRSNLLGADDRIASVIQPVMDNALQVQLHFTAEQVRVIADDLVI